MRATSNLKIDLWSLNFLDQIWPKIWMFKLHLQIWIGNIKCLLLRNKKNLVIYKNRSYLKDVSEFKELRLYSPQAKICLCVSDEAIIQYYWQDINQPLRTCIPCQWISCSTSLLSGKAVILKTSRWPSSIFTAHEVKYRVICPFHKCTLFVRKLSVQ